MNKAWRIGKQKYQQSICDKKPDFQHIQKQEKYLSKAYFQTIWIRLHQYNSSISKRIRSDKEGEMDYFNQILNRCGSILRDYCERYYPLPPDRSKAVNGYDYRSVSGDFYRPIHSTLPSLDFAELFRTHLQELAFNLFRFSVPISHVKGYVLRFLHQASFLGDWIYAGGGKGANRHENSDTNIEIYNELGYEKPRAIDGILREITYEIKAHYGTIGRQIAVRDIVNQDLTEFNQQLDVNAFIEEHKIENPVAMYLTEKVVQKLIDQRNAKARVAGTKVHEHITWGIPSPSIKDIRKHGDRFVIKNISLPPGYMLTAETYVTDWSTKGRVDLIVWKKVSGIRYNPVMLIDIKTKFSFVFDFVGKSKRRNINKIRPDILVQRIQLNGEQWEKIQTQPMTNRELTQLSQYHKLLSYGCTNEFGKSLPMYQAILRIAPASDEDTWPNLQSEIIGFLYSTLLFLEEEEKKNTYNPSKKWRGRRKFSKDIDRKMEEGQFDQFDQSIFLTPSGDSSHHNPRMSLVINEPDSNKILTKHITPQVSNDYFENHLSNLPQEYKRHLTLYLYHESKTQAGNTAAWIASFHHLFQLIDKRHKHENIVIIDMLGKLDHFKNARLRVNQKQLKETMLTGNDDHQLDYYQLGIESFQSSEMPEIPQDYDVYVFTGWDELKHIVDENKEESFQKMLIKDLPLKAKIFWMDQAKTGGHTSRIYKTKTIKPISVSDISSEAREIIYNLPVPPKKLTQKNPEYPGYRIILTLDDRRKVRYELISIIALRNHTAKFYSKAHDSVLGKMNSKTIARTNYDLKNRLCKSAFDLFPWLPLPNSLKHPNDPDSPSHHHYSVSRITKQSKDNQNLSKDNQNLSKDTQNQSEINHITPSQRLRFHYITMYTKNHKGTFHKNSINSSFQPYSSKFYNSIYPIRTSRPIPSSLLKANFSSSYHELEMTSKRRLRNIIRFIQKHRPALLTHDSLINLTTKLQNQLEQRDMTNCQDLLRTINRWEVDNLIPNYRLYKILKKELENNFTVYQKNNQICPTAFRKDSSLLLKYSLNHYLMIIILMQNYPRISDSPIKLWRRLLSFTLLLLGFYPRHSSIPYVKYRTREVWYALEKQARYFSQVGEEKYQRQKSSPITSYTHGFLLRANTIDDIQDDNQDENQHDGNFAWFYLEGYVPTLIKLRYQFTASPNAYKTILDGKTLIKHLPLNLDNYSSSNATPLLLINYRKRNLLYLSNPQDRVKQWKLVGQMYLHEQELTGILSIKQIYIGDAINDTVYPNEDPKDLDPEEIITETSIFTPQTLYARISKGYQKSIKLIFRRTPTYDPTDPKVLHAEEFTSIVQLVEHLRQIKREILYLPEAMEFDENINSPYFHLDPIEHVDWGGWIHFKAMVKYAGKVPDYMLEDDLDSFWHYHGDLYNIDESDLGEITIHIEHDDEKCDLCSRDILSVLEFVNNQRNLPYRQRFYSNEWYHDNGWTVSFELSNDKEAEVLTFENVSPQQLYMLCVNPVIDGRKLLEKREEHAFIVNIDDRFEGFKEYSLSEIQYDNDSLFGEDYWLRRLIREREDRYIKNMIPGSSLLVDKREVTQFMISNDGQDIVYLEYIFAENKENTENIFGYTSKIHKKIDYWKKGLNDLAEYYGLESYEDFKEVPGFNRMKAELDICKNCNHSDHLEKSKYEINEFNADSCSIGVKYDWETRIFRVEVSVKTNDHGYYNEHVEFSQEFDRYGIEAMRVDILEAIKKKKSCTYYASILGPTVNADEEDEEGAESNLHDVVSGIETALEQDDENEDEEEDEDDEDEEEDEDDGDEEEDDDDEDEDDDDEEEDEEEEDEYEDE